MINKYSISPVVPTALLSLLLIGCGGEDKGFLDPAPEISSLTAHPQVFVLKQGETQHVDLTQSVTAKNVTSWELSDLDDKSGLGAIVSGNKTTFDYKALTAGVGVINYTVRGQHLTASSQVVLAVNAGITPGNTLPIADNINLETLNNSNVSVDLRETISDADGDTLLINNLISASGRFTLNDHQVTFTPDGFVGVDQAVYSIDDGRGGYAMAYIAVVSSDANPPVPNAAPVAKDGNQSIDVAKQSVLSIDLSALISDADGDNLKLTMLYSTNGRAKIIGDKAVSYTPGSFLGVDQFTYLITDNKGGYDLGTITVNVSDSTLQPSAEPSLAAYPQIFTLELGQSQTVDLSQSVASANIDSWTLTQVQDNSGLGVVTGKTDSTFSYLAQSSGIANIGYTVQGGELTATSEIIAVINAPLIPENTPPNANNVTLNTLNNRSVTADLQDYISDEDGDTLNVTQLISATGRFTLNGHQVTFTPNGFVGFDHAVYSIEDGKGGYALGYIIATSADANPSVPNAIPTTKNLEKVIDVTTLPVWNLDLAALGLIADADGDALTIVNVYSADNRAVKQGNTGITYAPGAFRGVDQFTYLISDGKGGFAIGAITVVVNDTTPENRIPTAKHIEHHFTPGNSALSFSVKSYVHDADNDTVRLVNVLGASGHASVNSDEYIRYEPNGFIGTDRFVYIVTDDKGGYAMATVTIHVPDPNPTAPTASTAQVETTPNTPVVIDLSTVISDNETPTALLKITSVSNAISPATATLAGQKVTYTPNGFIGVDILTYVISDGLHQTTGIIVVTVNPYEAHDISAEDITMTTDAGVYISIDVTESISTTDLTAGTLSVVHAVGAALGDVTIAGNVLTYTPKLGAYGKDTFVYTVKDSHDPAHYAQGSITVEVIPPPPPKINELQVVTNEHGGLAALVKGENFAPNKTQYAWIIDGITVSTEAWYTPTAADNGFNIRLEVVVYNNFGQKTMTEHVVYRMAKVKEIYSTGYAFAALMDNGSVVTWGQVHSGGDSSAVASQLTNVKTIYSTNYAFAALKDDGSVVTWGETNAGGDSSAVASQLTNIKTIYSGEYAFAALKDDGAVVTWGHPEYGGDSRRVASQLSAGVKTIYSANNAFAALKDDGTVVTWGEAYFGGDSSGVASQLTNVKTIFSTNNAFAALKDDGSVVTWGDAYFGGDSSGFASQLTAGVGTIYSSRNAFAALKDDGSALIWGTANINAASQLTNVKAIYSSKQGFAALKNDGSMEFWGPTSTNAPSQLTNVKTIYSTNQYAFAALKDDGSVVTWGYADAGGDSSGVASQLTAGVKTIYLNNFAFAALKDDGSVVTWGNANSGGDSSGVASQLSAGVKNIYVATATFLSYGAFAALKDDGSVVTWGDPTYGGDSSSVQLKLGSTLHLIESSLP